jgi:hypothetical protein
VIRGTKKQKKKFVSKKNQKFVSKNKNQRVLFLETNCRNNRN